MSIAQGGLEPGSGPRTPGGVVDRSVLLPQLLVVGTHAAYTTGAPTGALMSRMEIRSDLFRAVGVPAIPAMVVRRYRRPPAVVGAYAWHRVRRIAPAYTVTGSGLPVYHFQTVGPKPGTLNGLFRNSPLQIYTDGYRAFPHQTPGPNGARVSPSPWRCRRWHTYRWCSSAGGDGSPALATMSDDINPAWLILVHNTHWMPDGARLWLYPPIWLGSMAWHDVTCWRRWACAVMAFVAIPLAAYFIVSTPIAGALHDVAHSAGRGRSRPPLCRDRRVGGGTAGPG